MEVKGELNKTRAATLRRLALEFRSNKQRAYAERNMSKLKEDIAALYRHILIQNYSRAQRQGLDFVAPTELSGHKSLEMAVERAKRNFLDV